MDLSQGWASGGLHLPGRGALPAGGVHPGLPGSLGPGVGPTTPSIWELRLPAAGRAGKRPPGPPQGQDGSLDHPRAGQLWGSGARGAAPTPFPAPRRPQMGLSAARERQSSVTGGQAFLSFWNNFQTLNSTAYTQKKDQSSKSHCAGTKTAPPPPSHVPSLGPRLPVPGDSDAAPGFQNPLPNTLVPDRPGSQPHSHRGPDPGPPRPHARALRTPARLPLPGRDGGGGGGTQVGLRAPPLRPFREMTFQAGARGKVIKRTPEGRACGRSPAWPHKEPARCQAAAALHARPRGGRRLALRPRSPEGKPPCGPERRRR